MVINSALIIWDYHFVRSFWSQDWWYFY